MEQKSMAEEDRLTGVRALSFSALQIRQAIVLALLYASKQNLHD